MPDEYETLLEESVLIRKGSPLQDWARILKIDLPIIITGVFTAGFFWAQFNTLAEEVAEYKEKVPAESVAVLQNDVKNIKEDVSQIREEQKEARQLLNKILVEVSKKETSD